MVEAEQVRAAAAALRASGCSRGLAGELQTVAWALPGSTTEHVVYDVAHAVGVWCSDVADLLDDVALEYDCAGDQFEASASAGTGAPGSDPTPSVSGGPGRPAQSGGGDAGDGQGRPR